jgi:hypothetical protein
MTLKHTTQATGTNDPTDQISVNAWNENHTIVDGIDLPAETPNQPAANILRSYGKKLAGRMMAAFKSSNEVDQLLQTYIGDGQTAFWCGNTGSTSLSAYGAIGGTTAGTLTNGNVGLTSKVQSINGVEILITTAATTAVASWRFTAPQWVRGNTVGGGFFMNMRVAPATGASNTSQRFWAGMRQNTAAPTDVEPSTAVHCIGFGWDAADGNCQIFTNDGTGAATKTDLGALWPVPVTDRAAMYDIFIFAPRNTSSVFITVIDLVDGKTYNGEFSADIPPQTTYLAPSTYASVGGISSVVGIRFCSCFLQAFS